MARDIKELAELLGAKVIGEVPNVGGGAFGAAQLARIFQERLQPGQGQRPGRPTVATWVHRPKVPMSQVTVHKLTELAKVVSKTGSKVTPMQVAAQLLEEAVARVNPTS